VKLPFDEGRRRRIWLMRHAEAAYVDASGQVTRDPRAVALTPHGRVEAAAMAKLLEGASFDRAVCSGLARTVETAEIVLGGRGPALEREPALEEVRGGPRDREGGRTFAARDLARSMADAHVEGARFMGGETFTELRERVLRAFERIVEDPSWSRLLLVCHGGVNRVILAWALGSDLRSAARIEQDSGCVNVIDLDHELGSDRLLRTIVRAMNVTAADPAKHERWLTTLEAQAAAFERVLQSSS
jgi:broad specificity phosphatase PhoE